MDHTPLPASQQLSRRGFAGLVGAGVGLLVLPDWALSARADTVTGSGWTAGGNPNGQLGDGTTNSRTTFGIVSGHSDLVEIAGGREHVLALDLSGGVWAWGDNAKGQIGVGDKVDRLRPTAVTSIASAAAVAVGHYHSMALLPDGTVRAWGFNASGQLGDGTTVLRTRPVTVSGLGSVHVVRGGRDMSMALTSDGSVWVWGLGSSGQLGNGTTGSSTTPRKVNSLSSGVLAIAAGRDHCLAIKSDGTVWAWGNNTAGEVGDGSTVNRTTPVNVSLPGPAVQVEAGAEHSVALLADGSVYCWGKGSRGALGTGGTARKLTPTKVGGGLPSIAQIGVGRDHTLTISGSGELWVWGFDDSGQLGDGKTTNQLSPERVMIAGNPLQVGGGRNYSVVLLA
jgi:alpha-tubulin suppressor-like RCC1 family protein